MPDEQTTSKRQRPAAERRDVEGRDGDRAGGALHLHALARELVEPTPPDVDRRDHGRALGEGAGERGGGGARRRRRWTPDMSNVAVTSPVASSVEVVDPSARVPS